MFAKAVHPAQVEALKGTVIQGIDIYSASNLPASKTFPPPVAIIQSHLLLVAKSSVNGSLILSNFL